MKILLKNRSNTRIKIYKDQIYQDVKNYISAIVAHLNTSLIHFNPTIFITSYYVKSFYAFHLSILIKNKRIFMIVHVNIRFHTNETLEFLLVVLRNRYRRVVIRFYERFDAVLRYMHMHWRSSWVAFERLSRFNEI